MESTRVLFAVSLVLFALQTGYAASDNVECQCSCCIVQTSTPCRFISLNSIRLKTNTCHTAVCVDACQRVYPDCQLNTEVLRGTCILPTDALAIHTIPTKKSTPKRTTRRTAKTTRRSTTKGTTASKITSKPTQPPITTNTDQSTTTSDTIITTIVVNSTTHSTMTGSTHSSTATPLRATESSRASISTSESSYNTSARTPATVSTSIYSSSNRLIPSVATLRLIMLSLTLDGLLFVR